MSTEPQTKLTLWDRLLADSPAFWKKVNYGGLIIGAIVAAIQTQIPEFPKTWLGLLAGISVGLVTASQFAVKDTNALAKQNPTIDDYINTAVDIKNQYNEVKEKVQDAVTAVQKPIGLFPTKDMQNAQAKEGSGILASFTPFPPGDILSGTTIIPTATLVSSEPAPDKQISDFANPAGNKSV